MADLKRMTWWQEFKWLWATRMLGWVLELTHNEMSNETLEAYLNLVEKFTNDPRYDVIRMRHPHAHRQ